jgi:hypothetical protein
VLKGHGHKAINATPQLLPLPPLENEGGGCDRHARLPVPLPNFFEVLEISRFYCRKAREKKSARSAMRFKKGRNACPLYARFV